MGKKQQPQSLASSEHAGTPLSDTGTVSSSKQLSTFAANKGVAATPTTSSIPSSVQMRRTTNKRGKQAPAPPKRTRYSSCVNICLRRVEINRIYSHISSLLSSSRDSTYRDDDGRPLDEQMHSNGIIMKSTSCSSFLVDVLMKGIISYTNQTAWIECGRTKLMT